MTTRERAEKLTEELFTSGEGKRATHLVMIDNDCIDMHRDLGGWGFGPVADRIEAAIVAATEQENAELRAMLAEHIARTEIAERRAKETEARLAAVFGILDPVPSQLDVIYKERYMRALERVQEELEDERANPYANDGHANGLDCALTLISAALSEEAAEPSEEEMAISRAKDRVLGEALAHCSKPGMENHCDICRAVIALEALIPPGNLEVLKLALLVGTKDGDQEARA